MPLVTLRRETLALAATAAVLTGAGAALLGVFFLSPYAFSAAGSAAAPPHGSRDRRRWRRRRGSAAEGEDEDEREPEVEAAEAGLDFSSEDEDEDDDESALDGAEVRIMQRRG